MKNDSTDKIFVTHSSEIDVPVQEQKEIEVLYRTLSEETHFKVSRDDIIKSSMVLKDCRGSRLSIVIDQNNEYSFMIFDNNRKFRDGGIVKSDDSSFCRLETLIEKINASSEVQIEIQESYFKVGTGVSIENEMFILRTIRERIKDASAKLDKKIISNFWENVKKLIKICFLVMTFQVLVTTLEISKPALHQDTI